ncbi:MAG: YceI family protein [Flavobacteriales bacterium]|nr:YceI family protein [Flavobacteriales bacterium]
MKGIAGNFTIVLFALLLVGNAANGQDRKLLQLARSEVTFVSDAPLERITAKNTSCTGLVDTDAKTFAVRVPIREFEGFNSPLQREHFNENYMASRELPNATFAGRIIEDIDFLQNGSYVVRAKGALIVHGMEKERIIPCSIVVTEEGVRITSLFDIQLADHEVLIPRIVQQKIASIIQVKVDLLFKREPKR